MKPELTTNSRSLTRIGDGTPTPLSLRGSQSSSADTEALRQRNVPTMQVIDWREPRRRRVRQAVPPGQVRVLYLDGDANAIAAALGKLMRPSLLMRMLRRLL